MQFVSVLYLFALEAFTLVYKFFTYLLGGVVVSCRISDSEVQSLSVRAMANGRPLIALCRLLLVVLINTALQIVNRLCSGFPVSGGI